MAETTNASSQPATAANVAPATPVTQPSNQPDAAKQNTQQQDTPASNNNAAATNPQDANTTKGVLSSPLLTLKPVEVKIFDSKQLIRNVQVQRREENAQASFHFDILLRDEEKQEYKRFVVTQECIKQVYLCKKAKQIVLKLELAPMNTSESDAYGGIGGGAAPQTNIFDASTLERPISQLALYLRPELEYETSNFVTLMALSVHGGSKKRDFYNALTKLFETSEISSDQMKEMLSQSDEENASSSWHDALLNIGHPTLEKPIASHEYLDSMDVARQSEIIQIMNRFETGTMQNPCDEGVVSEGTWKEWRSTAIESDPTRQKSYIESYNSLNVEHTFGSSEKKLQSSKNLDVFKEIETSSDDEQGHIPDRASSTDYRRSTTVSPSSFQRNSARILLSTPFKGQEVGLLQKITAGNTNSSSAEKKYSLIVTMYHIFTIVQSSVEQNGVCKVTTELYHDENHCPADMNPIPIADIAFMRLIPSKCIHFLIKKKAHTSGKFVLEECKLFTPQADVVFNIVRKVYRSTVSVSPYITQEDFEVLPMIKPAVEYHLQRPPFTLDSDFRVKFETGGQILSPIVPTLEIIQLRRAIKRDSLPTIIIHKNINDDALSFKLAWENSKPISLKYDSQSSLNATKSLISFCRRFISVDPLKYKLESMASLQPSGNLLHQEADDICGLRFRFESKSHTVVFSDYLLRAHDTENIISIEVDRADKQAYVKLYETNRPPQLIHTFRSGEPLKKVNYYTGRKSVMWMNGREQIVLTMEHCDRFIHHFEAVCSWCSHVDPFLIDSKTSYFHVVENDICNISLIRCSFRSVWSIERDYVPFTMNYNLHNVRLAKHLYEFHDCRELHFSAFVDCKMLKMQTSKSTKQCLILCSDEDGNGVYFIVEYYASWPISDFTIHQRGYISSIVELTNPKGSEIEIAHDGMVFPLSFDYRQDMRLFFSVMQKRYSKVPIHTKTKLKLKRFESSMEVVVQKLMDAAQNSNIHDLSKYWFRFQYMYMCQHRHFWKSNQLNPFNLFTKDSASTASSESSEKKRRGHEALLYYGSLKEKLKILRDLKMIETFEALYDMEKRIYERTPLIKAHFEEVFQEYETLRRKIVSQEQLRVQSPQARELLTLFTLKKRDINRIDYEYHSKNRSKSTFGVDGLCASFQQNLDTSGIQLLLEDTFIRGIPVEKGDLPSESDLARLSDIHNKLSNFRNEIDFTIQWRLYENLCNIQKRIKKYIQKEFASDNFIPEHKQLFLTEIEKINEVYNYYFLSTCSTSNLFAQVELQIVKHDVEKAENIVREYENSLYHVRRVLMNLWEEFDFEMDEFAALATTPTEKDAKGARSNMVVNRRMSLDDRITLLLEKGDEYQQKQVKLISLAYEQHDAAFNDITFLKTVIEHHKTLYAIGKEIERDGIPNKNAEQEMLVRNMVSLTGKIKASHTSIVSSLEKATLIRKRMEWDMSHSASHSLEEELSQRDRIHAMIKKNRHYPAVVNFFKPIQKSLQSNIEELLKRKLSVCSAVQHDGSQKLNEKLIKYTTRSQELIEENVRDHEELERIATALQSTANSTLTVCRELAKRWWTHMDQYGKFLREVAPFEEQDNPQGNSHPQESQEHALAQQFKQDIALLGQMLNETISTEHMTSFLHEIQKQSEPREEGLENRYHLSFRSSYARVEDLYSNYPAFYERGLTLQDFKEVWYGIQERIQFNSLEMGKLFAMLFNVPFEVFDSLFQLFYESEAGFVEEEQYTMQWPDAFQIAVALIIGVHQPKSRSNKAQSQYRYKLCTFTRSEISTALEEGHLNKKAQMQMIKTLLLNRVPPKKETPKEMLSGHRVMLSARSHHARRSLQMDFQAKRVMIIAPKSSSYYAQALNFNKSGVVVEDTLPDDITDMATTVSGDEDDFSDAFAPYNVQSMLYTLTNQPSFNWYHVTERRDAYNCCNVDEFDKMLTNAVEKLEECCRITHMKNRKTNQCLVYADNPQVFFLIDTLCIILQQNMATTSTSCMDFFCNFEHDTRISHIARQYFEQSESANPVEAVMGTNYSDQHLPDFIKYLLEESFFSSFFHILLENRVFIFDKTSCLRADGKDDSIKIHRSTLVETMGREIDDMQFFLSNHVSVSESDDLRTLVGKVGALVEHTIHFFQVKYEDTIESLQEAGSEYVGSYSHISSVARQQLCPLLIAVLQAALSKSLIFGKVNAWTMVEKSIDPRDMGNIFMMNFKECIDTINRIVDSTATTEQRFEAFVCYALNQRELAEYLRIIVEKNALFAQQTELRNQLLQFLAPLSALPMRLQYESSICAVIWDEFKRGCDIKIHHDQMTLSFEQKEESVKRPENYKFGSLRDILLKKYTLSELKAAAEVSISRRNPLLSTWTASANKAFHTGQGEWTIEVLSCTPVSDIRIGITTLVNSEQRLLGDNEGDYAWSGLNAILYQNGASQEYIGKPETVNRFSAGDRVTVKMQSVREPNGQITVLVAFALNRVIMGTAFRIPLKRGQYSCFYPAVSLDKPEDQVRLVSGRL